MNWEKQTKNWIVSQEIRVGMFMNILLKPYILRHGQDKKVILHHGFKGKTIRLLTHWIFTHKSFIQASFLTQGSFSA